MNGFLRSFSYAFSGMRQFTRERNGKIMIVVACVAVVAAFGAPSLAWRAVLILTSALVLACEMLNSAIERLLDYVAPQEHPEVKHIKDLMAAASLVMCLGALIVGITFLLAVFSGGQ